MAENVQEAATEAAPEDTVTPGLPAPTSEIVTPSGIEIRYFAEDKDAKVKRHYEIRGYDPDGYDGEPDIGWIEVPSVSTVVKVLDKPALPWWGMKVGIEGVITLFNQGQMGGAVHDDQIVMATWPEWGTPEVAGLDNTVELLKRHGLTTNQVVKLAGDRGQSAHDALEAWAKHGTLPDPDIFVEDEQPYVRGLREFLIAVDAEPVDSEVMVASVEHGYAGRYDLRIRVPKTTTVAFHRTPKKGPQYAELQPGEYLVDLKTSKDVYPEQCEQLEAYEHASVECGYEPTAARGVIKVGPFEDKPEGSYKLVRSWATFADFEATLNKYRMAQAMHDRAPKGYR